MVTATFRVEQSESIDTFRRRLYSFCAGRLPSAHIPHKIRITTDPLHGERFDGNGAAHLKIPINYVNDRRNSARVGHLHMNGSEAMNYALSGVPPLIDALLDHCGICKSELGLVAFHQANQFMLRYLRKLTKLSIEQTPIGMSKVGNTGSSSIPLLLASGHGLDARPLTQSVLCGFGIGLSLAAARLDLSATRFIEPVDVAKPHVSDDIARSSHA